MAMMLWKVYMGLTVIGIVLLSLGGMSVYNAIAHIFAAVSTESTSCITRTSTLKRA